MNLDEALEKAPNLHGLVVLRNGEIDFEYYGEGEDFRLNEPLGRIKFDAGTLHDIRSASKSVVALLYGVALAEGKVPGPGESLQANFPEYPADAAKAALTVEHALTMTLGLEWDESAPYTSTANSEIAMEFSPDRYAYVLERPVVEEPGTVWHYCGGASALIERLIAKGTGEPLEVFAQRVLFEPLGITVFEWSKGADGVAMAAAGLRLRPRDLATIGQLVLDGGRDIIPGDWIEEVLKPRVMVADDLHYGYQWWRGDGWVSGSGNGGQRMLVMPERRMVAAVAAGDYNDFDQPSAAAVLEVLLRA